VRAGAASVKFSLAGEWQFADAEAERAGEEIFSRYRDLFGGVPADNFLIAFYPFTVETGFGEWEADTRGTTSVIVSADMPFASQSPQRLHEQLRHEIFHFWIPNGVNLSGNYDWFYEGFALYESAKTGVATNTIRFEGFLDVLSRAHAIDARSDKKTSLVEASRNRFAGENTRIYARGMIAAFLCDLAMLEKSRGKRSSADILRTVYRSHNRGTRVDGNEAVLSVMRNWPELVPIVERYITGSEMIDWSTYLAYAGLEAGPDGLMVAAKLSGRQKDLLDKLGYNNWRKLPARMK
jgi:predicted metalloprotease with PDZ domain